MVTDARVNEAEVSKPFPETIKYSGKNHEIPRWSPFYSICAEMRRLLGDECATLDSEAVSNRSAGSEFPRIGQSPEDQENKERPSVDDEIPRWSSMYSACAEVQHLLGDDSVKLYAKISATGCSLEDNIMDTQWM